MKLVVSAHRLIAEARYLVEPAAECPAEYARGICELIASVTALPDQTTAARADAVARELGLNIRGETK